VSISKKSSISEEKKKMKKERKKGGPAKGESKVQPTGQQDNGSDPVRAREQGKKKKKKK